MKKESLIPKEASNFQKLIGSIQKLFAKELLIIFLILITAIPLAFLLAYLLAAFNEERTSEVFAQIVGNSEHGGGEGSFVVLYVIAVIGLYFAKLIFQAIQVLTKKDEE